jgi:hypothetical protein
MGGDLLVPLRVLSSLSGIGVDEAEGLNPSENDWLQRSKKMQVIYALGRPGHLDFYTTDKREALPAEAVIFATCTATSTVENTDEDLFQAITDQEYFTIKRMVFEARRREAAMCQTRRPATQSTLEISVSRFFSWLTSTTTVGDVSALRKNPSNC